MKMNAFIGILVLLTACGSPPTSIETIATSEQQDSLFKGLKRIMQSQLPDSIHKDSLAFLILPVQASCPSCRKKTIDSIMKHQTNLISNHYIIIAANGGRKTMLSYFREQNYELPIMSDMNQLLLDSNNLTHKHYLYTDKPTIYYTYNQKAYKKVGAVPATVRDDLREFFSGHR